jgi:hypothetical protein
MSLLPTPILLDLDDDSLEPGELSMAALMRELNLQQRPSWLLGKLMNTLEAKRQAKGLGWSRAWNKYGLTVFRTHRHTLPEDDAYFVAARIVFDHFLRPAPAATRSFAAELFADPVRLAFTFYHNHDAEGRQFEGFTLSLGRLVASDRSKRDRLDLIIEDERVGGRVDGLVDRLRVYACPWSDYQHGRQHHLTEHPMLLGDDLAVAQLFYEKSVGHYHQWKAEPNRQWNHWSARYIDYFGPRTFIPPGSSFT